MARVARLSGGRWGGGWERDRLTGYLWPVFEKSRCRAYRYRQAATKQSNSGMTDCGNTCDLRGQLMGKIVQKWQFAGPDSLLRTPPPRRYRALRHCQGFRCVPWRDVETGYVRQLSQRANYLNKTGNTSLRVALFMPSMVAQRYNSIVRQFAKRLLATGMAKTAVISAVTYKLTHLIYGVIRIGKLFDPNYLVKRLAIQDGI